MANYRDYAIQAYEARSQAEKDAAAAARQALVDAARTAARPLFTDSAGKLVLDPASKTTADLVDEEARLVVLTTADGSGVSFAIYPERDPVARYMAHLDAGEWRKGEPVADLDDVGEVLAGEGVVA